jgi:N-acetylmuramoyl-L-alanine amidase/Bacterial Ig-like domain
MVPSRHRWRSRSVAASIVASVGLSIGGLLAMPALPRVVPGPVEVRAAQLPANLDRSRTTDVTLPFDASDVSLHWHGNPNAHVSVQFAIEPGAFGEVVPVSVDDQGLGGAGRDEDASPPPADATTYGAVIWADDARFLRVTSDRPIGNVTVVAYKTDGPPKPVLATADDDGGAAGTVADAAVNAPPIVTRKEWGANENTRFDSAGHELWPPSYYPLQTMIVHHTDGRNNDPNPAATIRAIYYDDAVIRGWGDMGYNFLIDSAGRIYEGRHARNYAAGERHDGEDLAGNVARGAHARGFNSGTLGIVLLGTFDTVLPTTAARSALTGLLAWESERHGINPTTASTYTNPDLGTSLFLNHISGHRNVNATDCPGAKFYPTFPSLRSAVASRIAANSGPSVDHTAPAIETFTPLATNPTGGSSIDFGLVFTEPVTGLAKSDFSVAGTSSGWSVTGLKGIGSAYTVTVQATSPPPEGIPEGSVELDLAANAITDGASHTGPSTAASATAHFAKDTTPPTVTLSFTPSAGATKVNQLMVAVTFSEPVVGLTAADVTVGGTSNAATPWTVDPVVGSGAHYGFSIERASPTSGTLTIAIAAGATTDPAGNPNTGSAVHTVIIDRHAPTTSSPAVRLRPALSLSSYVAVTVSWTGSDGSAGSGIASYDVARSRDGGTFSVIATGVHTTSVSTSLSSGHSYRYEVRAHDKAGNVSGWSAGVTVKPSLVQQTSSSVTYHGTWTTTTSTVYSGGSDRYATAAGSSASISTSTRGVAFVTTRGPSRGQARVYVDGVLKATVDLNAASTQYRYVAYVASWSSLGTHRLTVIVVGTAGHPRVDLDAFEVLR